MASGRRLPAKQGPVDPHLKGLSSTSSFRAQCANRFLKLPRRQVKVGLNFGSKMGVVLEPKTVRDDLEGKALGNKATGKKHPVPPEQLLGAEARGPFNSILKLPVCELQMLRDSRDRKFLFFRKFEQVLAVRTSEMLPFARNREFGRFLGHGGKGKGLYAALSF